MEELAAIREASGRAGTYAALRFSADTGDQARGALMQRVRERATDDRDRLLFFELEWAALDDERVEELLAGEGSTFVRHYLRNARRYRPHLLTEPEERILTEKQVSGASAWSRLFHRAHLRDRPSTLARRGHDAPRRRARPAAVRRTASCAAPPPRRSPRPSSRACAPAPSSSTRSLHDKAVEDRLRHYPTLALRAQPRQRGLRRVGARRWWTPSRARYEIPQRWYALKARLLGVDRLADYDRGRRAGGPTTSGCPVRRAGAGPGLLRALLERARPVARRFFAERWIDAPARPGKRRRRVLRARRPRPSPYVLLNYDGRRRDVMTLAHELGHGLHFSLAGPRGRLRVRHAADRRRDRLGLRRAARAGRLLERSSSPAERLPLLAESVERAVATVFRQIAMHLFEAAVHTERREHGELSVERFGELWTETQAEMLGESVEITDGYRAWWSYIPHFIGSPGYVYAYAYGLLLALSVYERYLQEGPSFAPRYEEMLAAGGSRSPEELGRIVGVDLEDPGFWDSGLALVARTLDEAEASAREAGRL